MIALQIVAESSQECVAGGHTMMDGLDANCGTSDTHPSFPLNGARNGDIASAPFSSPLAPRTVDSVVHQAYVQICNLGLRYLDLHGGFDQRLCTFMPWAFPPKHTTFGLTSEQLERA